MVLDDFAWGNRPRTVLKFNHPLLLFFGFPWFSLGRLMARSGTNGAMLQTICTGRMAKRRARHSQPAS